MSEKICAKNFELLAQEFRQKNGLNSTEALNVQGLLKKTNVLTIYKPLSNGFSGMSIKIDTPKKKY